MGLNLKFHLMVVYFEKVVSTYDDDFLIKPIELPSWFKITSIVYEKIKLNSS